jgi:hypothetical protein
LARIFFWFAMICFCMARVASLDIVYAFRARVRESTVVVPDEM